MKNSLKRLWTFITVLAVVIAVLVPNTEVNAKITPPSNLGKHSAYTVMDARTGEVLLSDNMNDRIYPASTTKLVTAMVLLDKAQTSKVIKITNSMVKKTPRSSSKYGICAGQKYTLDTLLHMILISSSGDAAVAAAIGVYGSTSKCVKAMNAKVKQMGLNKTHFDNVIGLDIGDGYKKIYSTSYEMAQFTRYAMAYDKIKKIVAKKTYLVKQSNGKKGRKISNTNIFYSSVAYTKELYSIIGSKTGTTRAAGYVFSATAINKDGHEVICTYNGRENKVQTFKDIKKLLDIIYKLNSAGKITLSTGEGEIRIPLMDKLTKSRGSKDILTSDTSLKLKPYILDLSTGYKVDHLVGKFTYTSSDESVAVVDKNGGLIAKSVGEVTVTINYPKSAYYKKASVQVNFTIVE